MEVSTTNAKRTFNHFIMEMAEQILKNEAKNGLNSNWIFSPLSIQAMLGLIASGATGLTRNQMLSFLGIENIAELGSLSSKIVSAASSTKKEDMQSIEGSPILSFVNSSWIDNRFSIKPSFREMAKGVFDAEIKGVDFKTQAEEATEEINSWAKNATRGVIKNLISPEVIDSETLAVLVNALYFKATWKEFDASKTREDRYYLLDGKVLLVPFMSGKSQIEHLYGSSTDGFKILKIPYQQKYSDSRQFAMYFFLPDKVDGLFELVHQISSKPELLTQEFGLQKVELYPLRIPKFKISYGFEASETLKQLGLALPFSNLAELTEMIEESKHDGEVKLKVSKVIHKSFIEVNEEGTEAAAATAAVGMSCAMPHPCPSFIADHPFLFMVREETTTTVFFVGALINPSS